MADLYLGKIPIITGSLNQGFLRGEPDPADIATGCVPRDYDVDPVELRDTPDAIKLYSDSECDAVFDEQQATQSSLLHRFLDGDKPAFNLLDQNGHGYCWAYSVGHCIMLDRMKRNFSPIRLNPHATAAIIKGGRDEGGWSGLSCKFGREHGYAVEGNGPGQWPLHSRNLKYDTPELRANMAMHKVDESWYDLGKREWDQTLSKRQCKTLGLSDCPGAYDYNRFAHAMAVVCVVRFEPGAWGPVVLNSWKGWGYYGLGVLAEMWPDNAVAIRSSTPSVN